MANTPKYRRTQQELQKSLIKMVQSKSLSEVTIKELCERAEVNRSTFYAHYHNVIEVFAEILNDVKQYIFDGMKKWITIPDFPYRYSELVSSFLNYIQEKELTFRALLSPDCFFIFVRQVSQDFMTLVNSKHSFQTTLFNVAGFFAAIRSWLFNGMKESIAEISDQLSSVYLSTFMAEDGISK